MDKIAIACALEYTMFRFTNIWQKENLNLYNWLEKFNKNSKILNLNNLNHLF